MKYRNQQGHWTQVFSVNSVHFLCHTLISVKSEFLKKNQSINWILFYDVGLLGGFFGETLKNERKNEKLL